MINCLSRREREDFRADPLRRKIGPSESQSVQTGRFVFDARQQNQ